jgi:hypothetical protein
MVLLFLFRVLESSRAAWVVLLTRDTTNAAEKPRGHLCYRLCLALHASAHLAADDAPPIDLKYLVPV